jgi:hypothetical protein
MATNDMCCSSAPYFKAHEGKLEALKTLCDQLVQKTSEESGCLYCGFSFDGDETFCREGYENADAWLAHLGNIGEIFGEMLKVSDLTRLEVHAAASDVPKVRKTLGDMGIEAQVFALEYGFRK